MTVFWGLFTAVAAALIVALAVEKTGAVGRRAAEVFASEHGVPATPEGLELCRRYLSRSRQFRFAGSFAGLLLGQMLVYGISVEWVTIIPGWFLGVVAAELFRLRSKNRSNTLRTASLQPRSAARYVPWRLAWHFRALAVACLFGAISGLFMPWATDRTRLIGWGIAAIVVAAASEVCQRAVAGRTRPALPPVLERADDAIRRVGAMAVGYAGSAALAITFAELCLAVRGNGTAPPYFGGSVTLLAVAAIVWAAVLGWTEHRFFWPQVPKEQRLRRLASR
ncbi:MAG: hypothetical protein ACYDGN_04805 [Acidimicrobiales bacterium]